MNYILLIYSDHARWAGLSKDERNRVHEECTAWHEELAKAGQTRGATGLQPVTTATSLRESNGKVVVTDGPFAETKEFLGGFESVECANLDEALEIARRFPALRVGSVVEVRPAVLNGVCVD